MASGGAGGGKAKLTVNLSDLAVPEATVFANRCNASVQTTHVEFQFLLDGPGSDAIPVLSVMVPLDSIVKHLWESAESFYGTEKVFLERLGIRRMEVGKSIAPRGDSMVVGANIFRMARSGLESSIECYYLPPFSVFDVARRGGRPNIEPVVRVQMPPSVMSGLLEFVASQIESLTKRLAPLFEQFEKT